MSSRSHSQGMGRTQQIESVLSSLTGIRGVTAAALVDGDGFVTHVRRDFELDTDALGAAVQIALGASARAAKNVSHGNTNMVLMESKEGIILLAPIVKGFSLALVADNTVLLGATRFEVKESLPMLSQMLA